MTRNSSRDENIRTWLYVYRPICLLRLPVPLGIKCYLLQLKTFKLDSHNIYSTLMCGLQIASNTRRLSKQTIKSNVASVHNNLSLWFLYNQTAMQTKRRAVGRVANSTWLPYLDVRGTYVHLSGFHARRLILIKIHIHVRNNMYYWIRY